ncbi:MAG: transaldolase, partial [Actinomycetota bacterium]
MTTRLVQLLEQGQSAWLDNLQRGYLTSGHLQSLIDDGVRGLTSNPTIFQKAIQQSTDYDQQFAHLLSQSHSVVDAYWQMVIDDISAAADLFYPVFESSGGIDGYVSVEVDPHLA